MSVIVLVNVFTRSIVFSKFEFWPYFDINTQYRVKFEIIEYEKKKTYFILKRYTHVNTSNSTEVIKTKHEKLQNMIK